MKGIYSILSEVEKCVQYFGSKSEVKRLLGRPRHRWKDNKYN